MEPERPKDFGTVPIGWSRTGWIDYLRHLAEACRGLRPERAEIYEAWIMEIQNATNDDD